MLGLIAAQSGEFALAVTLFERALAIQPDNAAAHTHHGGVLQILRQHEAARASFEYAIALQPQHAEAYYNRAIALGDLGQATAARQSYAQAIALRPDYADACYNLALALHQAGHYEAALGRYEQLIASNPSFAAAYNNRGNTLRQLQRYEAALQSYNAAIALQPDYAEARSNRGHAQSDLKQHDAALCSHGQAIALRPDWAEAYYAHASALRALARHAEALPYFDLTIAVHRQHVEAYLGRAGVLAELRQLAEACQTLDSAIALRPDFAEAYYNRGNALADLGQVDAAIGDFERAIELQPEFAAAYGNRANQLVRRAQFGAAVQGYDQALALQSDYAFAAGERLHAMMHLCAWHDHDQALARLAAAIRREQAVVSPFSLLALSDDPALQQQAAQIWARDRLASSRVSAPAPTAQRLHRRNGRIRLGYYSADYHNHATAHLMAELFEQHDRSRFDLVAYSFGPERDDAMRRRLVGAFEQFVDVRGQSDPQVALLSRDMGIDIAVDLKGYTRDNRIGIFAQRAAPLQVSYLGYPGTLGTSCMDYLIADATLITPQQRPYYSENIVYLPGCYQVNDSTRQIAAPPPTRADCALPSKAFVFCCFNNAYKITPAQFSLWMRILARVEGSVLWLLADKDNAQAADNLRAAARGCGIDAERLIFAERLAPPQHLARHSLADLFLDTLPYNAHTTASDALWAGLPLLTCTGAAFAGRVATSLLQALHLPQLVTATAAHYEELAVALAHDPARLQQLRQHLAQQRQNSALFDGTRFARQIETAYLEMVLRQQAKLPPADIHLRP